MAAFSEQRAELSALMAQKSGLEVEQWQLRLLQQRRHRGYGPPVAADAEALRERLAELKAEILALDERISPLARASSEVSNSRWGLLMRAGNDKSLFARGVEKSADIYLSRVSNFLYLTPYAYLRAPAGSLPHDPGDPHDATEPVV